MTDLNNIKGKFITFEGVEGAGKSTQSKMFVEYLNKNGIDAVWTREPGGCPEAEEIRNIIINGSVDKLDGMSELLLMYAARKLHTEKKIKPLLKEGKVVVSDRYFDSTFAYQGFGSGIDLEKINTMRKIVLDDFKPDLTIILDIDIKEGLERANKRGDANRFEAKKIEFHNRVRDGFYDLLKLEPNRCKLIDTTSLNIEEVQNKIIDLVKNFVTKH